MTFEMFWEIRTHNGTSYQWEDITQYLVGFSPVTDSSRDPLTGTTSGSGFSITAENSDGFWFDLEKASGLGKRINKGTDPYSKKLVGRRVRIGVYVTVGTERLRQAWITGYVKDIDYDDQNPSVKLECESLPTEARKHVCDANSGPDADGNDFGIRGHNIEYDGEFTDSPDGDYALYKRKALYGEGDYSSMIEFYQGVRANDLLDHINRLMEVEDIKGDVETVRRRGYIRNADGELVEVKTADQFRVKDAETFHVVSETFGLLMADDQGWFCMIHDDGTNGFLTMYNYRTNTWKKWRVSQVPYRTLGLGGMVLPPNTEMRLGWWNSVSKRFCWVINPEGAGAAQPIIYEYDPATDTLSSQDLSLAPGSPGANLYVLCFAQETVTSGGGSLFVIHNPVVAGPLTIYELDVSDIAGGSITFIGVPTITDPNAGSGLLIEWGDGLMIGYPTSIYDTLGTPTDPDIPGLIITTNRIIAPQADWALMWVDIYGTAAAPGTGTLIWQDNTVTDYPSRRQTIFRINKSEPVIIFGLEIIGGGEIWWMRFVDGDWGTNDTKIGLRVAGKSHGYADPKGGMGVTVLAEFEPQDASGNRYTRFYFWASISYTSLGAGKLRSTDGDSLQWENQTLITGSHGDSLFGSLDNASAQTGLAMTLDSKGLAMIAGGFTAQTDPLTRTNWLFVYGFEIFYTMPLLDVRDLSLAELLSYVAQVMSYNWWFNPEGGLNFTYWGLDVEKPVHELETVKEITLKASGYDDKNLINSLRMNPWNITMQGGRFADQVEPVQEHLELPILRGVPPNQGTQRLKYLIISPTCSQHVKVKVEIINLAHASGTAEVFEYDEGTGTWISVGTFIPQMDYWTEPAGKYSITPHCWDGLGFPLIGDYWLFWTYEALYGLESAGDRFIFEVQDVESIAEHGKAHAEISDNRFLEKKDLQYVANRILSLRRDPKKRYELELLLTHSIPEVGDIVHFENKRLRITRDQDWRIIERERSISSLDGGEAYLRLLIEEVT
ncbi:hypothetical protein ES703_15062 [subsurface metagenome]